jgi:hypothetical protein
VFPFAELLLLGCQCRATVSHPAAQGHPKQKQKLCRNIILLYKQVVMFIFREYQWRLKVSSVGFARGKCGKWRAFDLYFHHTINIPAGFMGGHLSATQRLCLTALQHLHNDCR